MFSLKEAIISTPWHPKSLRDNKLERAGGELRPNEWKGPTAEHAEIAERKAGKEH